MGECAVCKFYVAVAYTSVSIACPSVSIAYLSVSIAPSCRLYSGFKTKLRQTSKQNILRLRNKHKKFCFDASVCFENTFWLSFTFEHDF